MSFMLVGMDQDRSSSCILLHRCNLKQGKKRLNTRNSGFVELLVYRTSGLFPKVPRKQLTVVLVERLQETFRIHACTLCSICSN